MSKQMSLDEFLSRILKKCEGKPYIFRGTTRRYSHKISTVQTIEGNAVKVKDGINSPLYRHLKGNVFFRNSFLPWDVKNEVLKRAGNLHYPVFTLREVVTDIQHFGGKTNLIDFSRSLYIALFFACDGKYKRCGELIVLDTSSLRDDDNWFVNTDPTPCLVEPAKTNFSIRRVLDQKSVFIYPSYGYVNEDFCKIFSIQVPAYLKKPILDYLRAERDIHTNTVYNDLIGFITNEKNYETAKLLFNQGFALYKNDQHEDAIKKYSESIELNPNYELTHNSRGNAKYKLGQRQNNLGLIRSAMIDYNRAIELDSNFAEAYSNRGTTKSRLAIGFEFKGFIDISMLKSAITDYKKAVDLDPHNPDFKKELAMAFENLRIVEKQ